MAVIRLNEAEATAIREHAEECARDGEYHNDTVYLAGAPAVLEPLRTAEQASAYPIEVDFGDRALAWLEEERGEMRRVVEENTRLSEGVRIDWARSSGDAFLVSVLESVAARATIATPEVKLAKAEVKALAHYAKTLALDISRSGGWDSEWSFTSPSVLEERRRGTKVLAERGEKIDDLRRQYKGSEDEERLAALEVYGVLTASLLGFSSRKTAEDWEPFPLAAVGIEFSDVARRYLEAWRDEIRGELDQRRATVEIDGGTRNEVFVLFVLDTIAGQLHADTDASLKAVA